MKLLDHKIYNKFISVYQIKNKINNKIYIGSSVNTYVRIASHRTNLLKNKHPNQKLQNAVNKYGIENFEVTILASYENSEGIRKKEYDFILKLTPEYNLIQVDVNKKEIISEETRKKIGIKSKQKFVDNPQLITDSKERIKKNMAGWNKGKIGIYTEEQRKNLSIKAKERWNNISEKDKIHLEKFLKSCKLAQIKRQRSVLQYSLNGDFIKEYPSLTEASNSFGSKSVSNFVTAAKKGIKLYNSYWKYKN